jgi:ligand-binding sensor domain-containing protein/serine phosphatase RsbU (regulator of sigma subunit)
MMRTRRKILITCVLILAIGIIFASQPTCCQNFNFLNFRSDKELAQPYVYSIIQDSHGYLWIGTGSGLSRYNGFTFELYTVKDQLAENFITCGISRSEDLWFGHMNGLISFYHHKKFQTLKLSGNSSMVTHFATSTDGKLWVSTASDGLFRWNVENKAFDSIPWKNPPAVRTFVFINDHQLLIGTDAGLQTGELDQSGEMKITRQVTEIPESNITAICKRKEGPGYFIATDNDGLFFLSLIGNAFHSSKILTDPDIEFTNIQDIIEDSSSNLWVASVESGLIRLEHPIPESARATVFSKTTGFSTDHVKTLFEDREGCIWSGNYGDGLTQITPKPFSIFSWNEKIYGNHIFSVCADTFFRWFGTDRGIIQTETETGRVVKFYDNLNGLPHDTVSAIYTADGKNIWIGTDKSGLFQLNTDHRKIRNFLLGNNTLENSVTCLAGKDGLVWVGTKKGLCRINSVTGQTTWYTISLGGLPHNLINSLYLDRKGTLWVSTNSGTLACIRDGKVYKPGLNLGPGLNTLGQITEDADSCIWLATYGSGVFRIKSDSIIHLNMKVGLLSDYCYSITCDGHNNIWVGHKGGLSRIRPADFSVKPITYFKDGAENWQFSRNAVSSDHKIIVFGTNHGPLFYDPFVELPQHEPPVLVITSFSVNDQEKDPENLHVHLSPGNYKITIDFLGVSLKEPGLVSYQYKLDGFEDWSDITKNTTVTYNHLSHGNYTFYLKASSGDGQVTTSPLIFHILINKPVWMKWWFYTLLVILMIILVYLYIKWRLHRLMSEKKLLEEKVKNRTNEIQCQKNEIELQRDLIERKNASITSSILYASGIQNAMLPAAEIIEKLIPESFILSLPKDIVSGDFYWLAEKDQKIIVTVADCTGHGVPGAFMSMLGITLISEIVNIIGITQSDLIVSKLLERVIQSLQQSRKSVTTSDGMDIALCVLDKQNNSIQFTGGMNDLIYIHHDTMEIISADHTSVSILYTDQGSFTKKEVQYEPGDIIYLASDGFQDQFGGKRDKKFLRQRFHSLLLEIHTFPMSQQKEILESRLKEWMGSTDQTDDITVMGIRL